MALSNFLSKFKRNTPEAENKFLAIQIDAEFLKTAVWEVAEQTTKLVAVGSTQEWDGSSTEILLEAMDASLTRALEQLPEDFGVDPDQVIFGLPETWVLTEGVVPARLADLKILCERMAFKPLGFVVTTEAITHYLKIKEGTPLTAILIKTSVTEAAVTIVRVGKIEGTHAVGRSGDLAADVREGLARFGEQESLPTRMILYDGGEDLNDLSQQLMAFDWQEHLPFLHLPNIEPAENAFSITAIAMAGGAEIAKSLGFTIEMKSDTKIQNENVETSDTKDIENIKDVGNVESIESVEINEDEKEIIGKTEENVVETAVSKRKIRFPKIKLPSLRLPKLRLPELKLARFNLRFMSGRKLTAVFVLLILGLIMAGIVMGAKRLPKANIFLTFNGQSLNQKVSIIVDPKADSVDAERGVLPATEVKLTKSAGKQKNVSGTKMVGDKAAGTVTIYNMRKDGSKNFPAGTIISRDKLKFATDAEVTVASASGTIESTVSGKANVNVTAADFGPEYNLEAGVEFQTGDFSKSIYAARNDAAFSGGTKKDVAVVAKKDVSDLRNDLLTQLKEESAAEIKNQADGKRVFVETLTAKPIEEKLSTPVLGEAEVVTMDLTAEVTALAVEEKDLNDLLSAVLRDEIPEGFTLPINDFEVEVTNVLADEGKVAFEALVKAKLSPIVSQTEILDKIAGKRPKEALEQIQNRPHFKGVKLELVPNLPAILQWMPVNRDKIYLEIRLEG